MDNIEELGEYGNINITYEDDETLQPEVLINITRCTTLEDESTQVKNKKSSLEEEIEVPKMELDDGTDELKELEEDDEDDSDSEDDEKDEL